MHEIIDKFLVKQNIAFDTVIFQFLPQPSVDVFNEFLAQNTDKFLTLIRHNEFSEKFLQEEGAAIIPRSAIFFLSSIEDIINIEIYYIQIRHHDQPIKYFIYIPNLKYSQLESKNFMELIEHFDVTSTFLLMYMFFVIDSPSTVTLATFEWFSPGICRQAVLTKVNVFNKKSNSWTKELKNYDKFMEYNGCELTLLIHTHFMDDPLFDSASYAVINRNYTNFEVNGIVPKVFEIASKANNFIASYQPAAISLNFLFLMKDDGFMMYYINDTYKVPTVYFTVKMSYLLDITSEHYRSSHAFVDTSYHIYVTPGELYTPYEKLFLPFDLETWIMLIVTFSIAFLSILIINRLSKSVQTIVYGHRVDNATWNVVRIFFGMSMTRLPTKKFSRIILLLFIFFCLIFRTCYQSKFYDFMTTAPRRLPPRTIDEFVERNYTLCWCDLTKVPVEEIKNKDDIRPSYRIVSIEEFYDLSKTQSHNSTAKLGILMDEFVHKHLENEYTVKIEWNQLRETFFVSHETFGFFNSVFYFRMFKKLIDRLIETGVMKYLSDNYYIKVKLFDELKVYPPPLNLYDTMVGFNLWLGCCGISLVVFIIECLYPIKKSKDESTKVSPPKEEVKDIKLGQIYPLNETTQNHKLKPETIQKFRVKTKKSNNQESVENKTIVVAEVHKSNDGKIEDNKLKIPDEEAQKYHKPKYSSKVSSVGYDDIEEI